MKKWMNRTIVSRAKHSTALNHHQFSWNESFISSVRPRNTIPDLFAVRVLKARNHIHSRNHQQVPNLSASFQVHPPQPFLESENALHRSLDSVTESKSIYIAWDNCVPSIPTKNTVFERPCGALKIFPILTQEYVHFHYFFPNFF